MYAIDRHSHRSISSQGMTTPVGSRWLAGLFHEELTDERRIGEIKLVGDLDNLALGELQKSVSFEKATLGIKTMRR